MRRPIRASDHAQHQPNRSACSHPECFDRPRVPPSICERNQSEASKGDLLVRDNATRVELTHTFKPGEPNGLFDGGVAIVAPEGRTEGGSQCGLQHAGSAQLASIRQHLRTLARERRATREQRRNTDWQLLSFFDGTTKNKGREKAPSWAKRLSENLCRKGDFQDL